MAKNKASKQSHQLRIIAGKWRGQKVNVIDQDDLRPTTDRIRETLFNWLALPIVNADCLDAFAGSGILTFEALSREAKSVVSVEKSKQASNAIKQNAAHLKVEHWVLFEQDVANYLENTAQSFDIVFLDPPFSKPELLIYIMESILSHNIMKKNGLIYVEIAKKHRHMMDSFRQQFTWLKEKTAGQVCYALLRLNH